MPYRGSYLWQLRQAVGHDLVLMPGAMIALQRDDQRILLTKRTDDGSWCLPDGDRRAGRGDRDQGRGGRPRSLRLSVGGGGAHDPLPQRGTSPIALRCSFWRRPGRETPAPTRRRRRRRSSSTRQRLRSRFMPRLVTRWNSCEDTSTAALFSSA